MACFCCRRINTTTSLVVLFHLPRAERFVRHALLAEPAFLDLRRGCSFYPSLGNSEEMVNSTFPCPIGTFFTQTHSPESRAPGRRQCEEAFGRPKRHHTTHTQCNTMYDRQQHTATATTSPTATPARAGAGPAPVARCF